MRYALIAVMLLILLRCAFSLILSRGKEEIWGTLVDKKGASFELRHWENLIGRGSGADVRIDSAKASRIQAALVRDVEGNWTVTDLDGSTPTLLRGKAVKKRQRISTGDTLSFGGVELSFTRTTKKMEESSELVRLDSSGGTGAWMQIILLTALTAMLAWELIGNIGEEHTAEVLFAFGSMTALSWAVFLLTLALGRRGIELEILAFMLTDFMFAVCLSSDPENVPKLAVCFAAGTALYLTMGLFLRSQNRIDMMRIPIALCGLALLAVNLVSAQTLLGAKNWLSLGGISFQPSEIVKLAFIFAGSVSLERIFSKGNLVLFMGFAALCVGSLALMRDFGTALVFFTVYLVIAFLRSGSFTTVFLSAMGAILGALIAITARPYIADRFSVWGHAWEDAANLGFQQARTMTALASGGLFGLGGGKGWFRSVFASDTDMVFGIISEEYGFIVAVLTVLTLLLIAMAAVRSVRNARSSFYAIAACAAVSFYLAQLALNVFGSLDMLPFTGVTFPFVSKGGTSLIASWGMLAFVKAADTRPSASFAVLPPGTRAKKKKVKHKKDDADEEA